MSYLDQFLKETSTNQKASQLLSHHNTQSYEATPTGTIQSLMHHGGSVESEEGDIEDNRALSITSSKSNLSELSVVNIIHIQMLFIH